MKAAVKQLKKSRAQPLAGRYKSGRAAPLSVISSGRLWTETVEPILVFRTLKFEFEREITIQ